MSWSIVDVNTVLWNSFSLSLGNFLPPAVLLVLILVVVVRLCNFFEASEHPMVVHNSTSYVSELVGRCPILLERYQPPRLWGKNTHAQVWLFGVFGRFSTPSLPFTCHSASTEDGASLTFCIFENEDKGAYDMCTADEQPIVVVCPGIAGHCRSSYLQAFTDNILRSVPHSRVVILNHLGTDEDRELSTPRIFSYGSTSELSVVVDWVREHYPLSPLLAAGFSMGANILTKYLAEKPERQSWFIGALSCSQGYRADACAAHLSSSFVQRIYNVALGAAMQRVLRKHRRQLFAGARQPTSSCAADACAKQDLAASSSPSPSCLCRIPPPDEVQTYRCWQLTSIDEYYNRRALKFQSADEFYRAESCGPLLHKIADVPVLFLNGEDDPIVPPHILAEVPERHSRKNDKSIFVRTRHGSHLAFFEGGLIIPNRLSWMDRLAAQYFHALLDTRKS